MRLAHKLAFAPLLFPAALAAFAQTAPPVQPPAARTPALQVTTQLVTLDIAIHDKSGAPVRGLTAADFAVTDDQHPEQVLFVEEHDATQPMQDFPRPPLPPGTYSNVPSAPLNDALNIILMDGQDTSVLLQSREQTDLRRFAEQIPPGAQIAVFRTSPRLSMVCGFTSDRVRITQCLLGGGLLPSVPVPSADIDRQANILLALNDFLSLFPGRKNILWLGSNFGGAGRQFGPPQSLGDADSVAERALTDAAVGDNDAGRPKARINDVAIYPFDPSGVTAPVMFQAATRTDFAHPDQFVDRTIPLRTTRMEVLAQETGGHAFYGNNDIASKFRQAIVEGSSYYTITYKPTYLRADKLHKVDVHVLHHHGIKTAYRPGYLAAPPLAPPQLLAGLPPALLHGGPESTGVLFRVAIQPGTAAPSTGSRVPGPQPPPPGFARRHSAVLVPVRLDWTVLPAGSPPGSLPGPAVPAQRMAFNALLYNDDGKLLDFGSAVARPDVAPDGTETYTQTLSIPFDDGFLRLNITTDDGRTGSLELPLKLPRP